MRRAHKNQGRLTKDCRDALVVGCSRNGSQDCGEELGVVFGLLPIDCWKTLDHDGELPEQVSKLNVNLGSLYCLGKGAEAARKTER